MPLDHSVVLGSHQRPLLGIGSSPKRASDIVAAGYRALVSLVEPRPTVVKDWLAMHRGLVICPFDDSPFGFSVADRKRAECASGSTVLLIGKKKPTLVCCQAGLNRSALVAVLVLLSLGERPQRALEHVRKVRGETLGTSALVLSNPYFVRYVRSM